MHKEDSSKRRELVRHSLEYLGVDPDNRSARMRLYGKLVGTVTLAATAVGAGALYLKGMALIW
jgi:hypothetical protein